MALVACSSAKNKIQIISTPSKATVSAYSPQTKEFQELGQTPLTLKDEDRAKLMKGGKEYIALKLTKPGYAVESLIIDTKIRDKIDFIATLNRLEIWTDPSAEASSTVANKLATKIQKINKNIFKKKLPNALIQVNSLIDQYPKAPIFYDMKGSILLLMGKNRESIIAYRKSLALQPDNIDSQKALDKLTGGKR